MIQPRVFITRYVLAVLVFNLAACSSMRTVSIENAMRHSPPSGVDFGSLVEVKTLDRQTVKFRVTDINDLGLGGSLGFFAYHDMKSLKVEGPPKDNSNVLGTIVAILGVAALVVLVANADSVAVCSPSPCSTPDP